MFSYLNGYPNQKCFAQWDLNAKVVQTSATACLVPLPDPLFGYLPEPIKEGSLLSRESQQRQPPLPTRLPTDFRTLRHQSLPHPNLRRYEATLRIPETTSFP
jgi:hypothetical protein